MNKFLEDEPKIYPRNLALLAPYTPWFCADLNFNFAEITVEPFKDYYEATRRITWANKGTCPCPSVQKEMGLRGAFLCWDNLNPSRGGWMVEKSVLL